MKFIYIIFFIFLSNVVFANEEENSNIEVINLHESKSLDQMVLDNLIKDDEIKDEVDIKEQERLNSSDEIIESKTNEQEVNQIEIF